MKLTCTIIVDTIKVSTLKINALESKPTIKFYSNDSVSPSGDDWTGLYNMKL